MTPLRKTIKNPLKNNKGFTLLELMIVTALVSILASIAMINYAPFTQRAYDITARSEARYLIESVVIAAVNEEDVDYTKLNTGGAVGNIDTVGNPRQAVFSLSSGVLALIVGDSIQAPNGDTTVFLATIYHTSGTDDPTTLSGKREFTCSFNEATVTTILP